LIEGVFCYPNPVETQSEIHLNKSFSGTISLYNSIGELLSLKKVYSRNSLTLPDAIEQGSYVITFSNDLSHSTQSIIVK
jgi:hypothetical protein